MKQTLGYDKVNRCFVVQTGKPQKKFRLGADARIAQQRKEALGRLWENGGGKWTVELIQAAKAIASGKDFKLSAEREEHATDRKESATLRLLGGTGAKLDTIANIEDFHGSGVQILQDRIAQLEALVKQHAGPGAVAGITVTLYQALDAYHAYRKETDVKPGTNEPTDYIGTVGRMIVVLKRCIDDRPLTSVDYMTLNRWAKAVAARPLSKKTGSPIKIDTVKNVLKVMRLAVKWASHYYGWKKPEEWRDATFVLPKRTQDERIAAKAKLKTYYTYEEIGTLWKYARGVERLLILCGINFGYAQMEIRNMLPEDLGSDETVAIRGKSETLGVWPVWPETQKYATWFDSIPDSTQGIANRWNKLVDRVHKLEPEFRSRLKPEHRRLSFKWLRKSGSSLIRKIAGGEIASIYVSHGESAATDDKLLDLYADTDWSAVSRALTKMHVQLEPFLIEEELESKPHMPMNRIKEIEKAWKAGMNWKEICQKTGVSRDTVYRYRPIAMPKR